MARFMLLFLAVCASAQAQSIVVDSRSIAQFDSIPPQYAEAARKLRMLFMDRSVGGNINDALNCLSVPFENAPNFCKRHQHRDSAYAVSPSEVRWIGAWDRSNWRYEFWPAGCSEDAICFINFIEPRIDSFDVVGYQFSYLAVNAGTQLTDPNTGFFTQRSDRNTAAAYAAFAARHPGKTVIWWTTSLARGIGTPESQAFNDAMRSYAAQNRIVLFDVADILSHDPSGRPCYDNRDGVPYLTENHPDDGIDIPAICPQYTTETDGGHLGSISAGGIRVAKAFWVLMARIAGWQGAGPVDTLHVPSRVELVSPAEDEQLASDTVNFVWRRGSPQVSRYRLDLSLDQDFRTLAATDSMLTDTATALHALARSQRYYWRVQARNADGWGAWSVARSFTLTLDSLFSTLPLTEMGSALYKGYPGGLYPPDLNERPAAHNSAGLAIANGIVPLDSAGRPDPVNGRIVMLSIGMSNTGQEYSFFENMLDTFKLKNPRLVSVSGAQAGQTASIIKDPDAQYWTVIEQQRLFSRRVTKEQVQVVWLKQANIAPSQDFPAHAELLRDDIREILRLLPVKFPNVKLAFLSSRTFGGYATTPLNPEPYAFESGYSVKWLIEEQLAGDPALSYTGNPPAAPWLSWGPYLWADGPNPRLEDGLYWVRDDFIQDGTHPSDAGREKVARLLLRFFSTDETATPWFLAKTASRAENAPSPGAFKLSVAPNPASDRLYVKFRLPKVESVRLEIFNGAGAVVSRTAELTLSEGEHERVVEMPRSVFPPGVYFARVASGNASEVRGVVLLR